MATRVRDVSVVLGTVHPRTYTPIADRRLAKASHWMTSGIVW